jgi:predicted HTH transcriptional regulator
MRISVEDALAGGKSDCRNRNLQRMFSLIGLGEQAGSGIPRIVKNWDALSFRQPELWEDTAPPATLMRLRTVSLLPEEALRSLQTVFGGRFDALSDIERMALVTAQVEGFVSNLRLQQVCRDHPHDITKMFRRLVIAGFLVPDGVGRATTYRMKGAAVTDLAEPLLENGGGRVGTSETSSPHKGLSSSHNESSSPHLTDETRADWGGLMVQAERVRNHQRMSPENTREVILALCEKHFLTAEQFSKLLGRNPQGIRDRFLTPLLKSGLLEHRFPATPNHEQQAYRKKN